MRIIASATPCGTAILRFAFNSLSVPPLIAHPPAQLPLRCLTVDGLTRAGATFYTLMRVYNLHLPAHSVNGIFRRFNRKNIARYTNATIQELSLSDSEGVLDEVTNWGRIRVFSTGNQLATRVLLPVFRNSSSLFTFLVQPVRGGGALATSWQQGFCCQSQFVLNWKLRASLATRPTSRTTPSGPSSCSRGRAIKSSRQYSGSSTGHHSNLQNPRETWQHSHRVKKRGIKGNFAE
jgi:hypothetical protein